MTLNDEHIRKFIDFLETQHGPSGRAFIAELRRAAADPLNTNSTVWLLDNRLPNSDDWDFNAYRLVAVLFAIHATRLWELDNRLRIPRHYKDDSSRSFGASLRKLRNQLKIGQQSLDLRVKALIDTNREDLAQPLCGLVQRVVTVKRTIPVDYRYLLTDLVRWEDGDEVRRAWSRDYWNRYVPEAKSIDSVSTNENQSSTH